MPQRRYTAEETVRRGRAIYEERIRSLVEPAERGRYVLIDIDTGDYETGDDYHAAAKRMLARRPNAALCGLQIGYATVGRIGARRVAG